ncbi:Tautomerase enzyme [Rhizobium sp. ICMP 5592]|uniref:tautomerase family protein n=1 Tax=Rhizobium sp. ICMP 5592 TaxID=2292445 RepID=UPI001294BEF1|nr:Tautomerase enzyme [Rhizobium sp. ICMP 5592]MQB44078.1 Tautomerase enzyme [Rhizobium sp. ICMP 5592]
MPITLTVPEGLLSSEAEAQAFAELTDALLKISQLSGNAFMTPNVVGTINVLPKEHVFSGGKPAAAAFIELKLPGIALATTEAKQAFTEAATTIVERASNGKLSRDHIWTNIVYAADGSWGIGGQAYGNAELVSAIQQAAAL